MRICVIAGMIDDKLHAKIAPLQNMKEITQIHLIRRQPYAGDKIICHSPPERIRRFLPLAEAWRFLTLLRMALFPRPKVIIAFGIVPHGVYAGWVGWLLRIRVIQHVMGKNDLRLTFRHQQGRNVTLKAVKRGRLVAVRGESMKEWLVERGIPEENIFIPQNVHDFYHFRAKGPGDPEAIFDFVYVGLLSGYKRIDVMLDALALARKSLPGLKLLLVGDGPKAAALTKKVKKLKLDDAVHFAGNRALKDLPDLLHSARIFLMTSQGEGLPQAMLEAMSCGLPAIVPDDADIREVAVDGENALLVDPPTVAGFAQAMVDLSQNPHRLEVLTAGAQKIQHQYRQAWSLKHQTEVWQKAITSIL
ncbi:MAG: glycosyltransferase family 4 protein [Magnetococcales bacterium]|nr:glycosyltransferase family 4 protein [Magnetococcales bacterium]